MRSLVLSALALSLAAGTLPAAAESYRYRRDRDRDGYSENDRNVAERRQRRQYDSAEHDRAQNCDAAGRFSGYPDWARNAFACGGDRR